MDLKLPASPLAPSATRQSIGEEGCLRILFVAGATAGGGAEHQLDLLCKGLHEIGHSPMVVTFRGQPIAPPYPLLSARHAGRGRIAAFARISDAARIARRTALSWDPDAAIFWLAVPTLIGAFAWPRHRGIRVAAIRNAAPEAMPSIPPRLHAWCVRRALSRMQLIVANSSAGLRQYEAAGLLGPQATEVVQNCREPGRFRPPSNAERKLARMAMLGGGDAPTVLYVGRNAPEKNIPLLATTIAHLRRRMPGCRVLVAGLNRSALGAVDESLLREDPGVIPLGRITDVRQAYWAADALVLTSNLEGSPNAVHEARACGLSIISTDCGDVMESATEVDAIVTPHPDAIAEALVQRLLNPVARIERGAALTPADCARAWVRALNRARSSGRTAGALEPRRE